MLQTKVIGRLQTNTDFRLFSDWILDEIQKIDSTSDLTKLSNASAGEEAKIRAKTVTALMNMLSPILGFKERKDPSVERVQEAKDKAGL